MFPDAPLVIPEVNAEAIRKHKGLVSSELLDDANGRRAQTAPRQRWRPPRRRQHVPSDAGAGLPGNRDLVNNSKAWLDNDCQYCECETEASPYPIGFNCIPQIGGEREFGYTSEELKLLHETRKILDDPSIQVCPTPSASRSPTAIRRASSSRPNAKLPSRKRAELFRAMPGAVLMDDLSAKSYPTPYHCHDTDDVYVGRIREDISAPNSLAFWCVADNLRKGAATNAVQIAEWIQQNL